LTAAWVGKTDVDRRRLLELAAEAWDGTLAADPLYATAIGDRRFLAALPPNDADAGRRERARVTALLEKVSRIDPSGLVQDDQITRSALLDHLRYESGIAEADLARWAVDPLDGPQVALLNVESYQPIESPADAEAAVDRWREMGPFIDRHVEGIRRAAAEGIVAPRSLVMSVVDELDDLLARPVEAWPLTSPARSDHESWPQAATRVFRRTIVAVCEDVIRPAFERQRTVLADEIRSVARPDEHAGLAFVPGGEAAYANLVRSHTTLELSADEIHRLGVEEVARIDGEFLELGARLLGTATTAQSLARLRQDPALTFDTAAEVEATARAALDRANAAIGGWFGRLPAAPCQVVVMGEHESKHSTIAYYREPAADGSRPGRYYLNTSLPKTRPRYEAECLAFHEAVPGHHLQLAIAQELDELPAFRRFGGPTAYVEGWGLYTERLSAEMGLYSGELDHFGILSFDAWRACRLVVDTGLHALGWPRQRAIDYMLDHTALAENNVINEIDRYLAMPGQALAYKIGQLELLRLRREARDRLGPRFDVRRFHDAVLGVGAIGLVTLGTVIESWIAEEQSAAPGG